MRSQKPRQKSGERRYSYEDMKSWCQKMVEGKTQLLLSEINQNNSIIKILSQKLANAESQLQKKQQMLQSVCQKLFSTIKGSSIEIINKLLNDKLRDKFQIVNNCLFELENKKSVQSRTVHNVSEYQNAMEQVMTSQIQAVKQEVRQKMGEVKAGNQKYWGKIKGWARMFEEKQKKCEEGILALHKDLKRIESTVGDGVMEVFKMKNLKHRLKEMEQAMYDIQESFKLVGEKQIELKQSMQVKEFRPETIELSYSKDQSQIYYVPETKKSYRSDNQYFLTTQDQQPIYKGMNKSPYKVNVSQTGSAASSAMFRAFQKKSTHMEDFSILSSVKSEEGRMSFSSRLKSLQNVSTHIVQSRKAMVAGIKTRLKELIDSKGLQTPVRSYLDELNYLKNDQNNYMFDCEGNMFKLNQEEYRQLCFDKVLMQG